MNIWLDDISLLMEDFFSVFRGNLYEKHSEAGGVYQVTSGSWVVRTITTEYGKPSYSQNLARFLAQAGNVQLQAVGGNNDLFYGGEVRVTDYNLLWEEPFSFQGFTFGKREFWIDGAKHVTPEIEIPLCNPVLFGIYEDDYNRILEKQSEYEVTIYIHYQT